MFSETDIINMLECLIDNIFVIFGGLVIRQTVGTYEWIVHNGKIEIISFVVKFRSRPPLTVNLEV
jgi:hypothetical protein